MCIRDSVYTGGSRSVGYVRNTDREKQYARSVVNLSLIHIFADTIEECMDDLIAEINKNRRILEFRFVEGTIKLYADDKLSSQSKSDRYKHPEIDEIYSIYEMSTRCV